MSRSHLAGRHIERTVVEYTLRGVRNCLIRLGMVEGEPEKPPFQFETDSTKWIRARHGGFSGSTPDGNRTADELRRKEITADIKGSYVREFGVFENTFLFGGQGFLSQAQSAGGSGRDFPGPGLETPSVRG